MPEKQDDLFWYMKRIMFVDINHFDSIKLSYAIH